MSTTSDTPATNAPANPSSASQSSVRPGSASSPTPQPLSTSDRLDVAQRDLRKLRERLQRATLLTVVIAALLLLVMGGYAYYLSRLWNEFTEPAGLVNLAETMIDENLPKTRATLEKQI